MTEAIGGGYAVEMWLAEDYAGGLQGDVERELAGALESAVERGRVSLTVELHEGIVRLVGYVSAWAERVAACAAVMRVRGVVAVDDGGVVLKLDPAESRSDAELTAAVRYALDWDSRVPRGAIRVAVTDGRVTLSGQVAHDDARTAAAETVTRLVGVRDLVNAIVVPVRPRPLHAITKLQDALASALGRDAKHVRVSLTETGVRLTGRVPTLAGRLEAERAVRRLLGDVPLSVQLR